MLKNVKTFSSFSVKNLEQAKQFYEDTLGLNVKKTQGGLQLNLAGGNNVFLYQKDDHVPATFTVLNFLVNNIDQAVDELIAKGIKFEQYNQPYMKTDAKGVARGNSGGPTIAWFKDPFGNFLSVIEGK